jgi:tripartite-type tricarboxylate transporter receptor subunit TctC
MIKGLVVAVPARLPAIPDVPTAEEQGLPAFQAVGWNALFAPRGTPREIVDRLNAAARAALDDDNVRARLLDLSVQLPDEAGRTPEALRAFVAGEIDKWVPIIRKAGVTVQQ